MKINWRLLIGILFFAHLGMYLCWTFIIMDLTTPFTLTFGNSEGRGAWLCVTLMLVLVSGPFIDDSYQKLRS